MTLLNEIIEGITPVSEKIGTSTPKHVDNLIVLAIVRDMGTFEQGGIDGSVPVDMREQ